MLTMGMMAGGSNLPRYSVAISTNGGNWLSSITAGLPTAFPIDLTVTVLAGVERQGSTLSGNGTLTFNTADGSIIRLVNEGYIIGAGGQGGYTGNQVTSDDGLPGGAAVEVQNRATIIVTNAAGYIWGGGGGGGGGGDGAGSDYGGGGGGGAGGGAGGLSWQGTYVASGAAGTAGRTGAAGAGGSASGGGGAGGNGGSYGAAGQDGIDGDYAAGSGGAPGNAIKYAAGSTVTWISGASRILGPVGT